MTGIGSPLGSWILGAAGWDWSWACPRLIRYADQKAVITVIFKNLLDNARQYTENRRAFVLLESGRMLVGNKGHIVRDVDIFSRGVSRSCNNGQQSAREGAGNGLGLSLAQRACERMGWRLELASLPAGVDGVTVFSLIFPPAAQGEDV